MLRYWADFPYHDQPTEDHPLAADRDALRDWHRLFGLLLTDFFTDSPFTVEVERDLSEQQQYLDVVILRRGGGKFVGRLPDGLDGLAEHNLITFKSYHEAVDDWAMKELVGHYVAYRKLVSPTPSDLIAEDRIRLYAVCARFPQNLSSQVPWQKQQAGVYNCNWGTDVVRVIVAGQLPREAHNAPLHLFSASPELVGFGSSKYTQRSQKTSLLIRQLFKKQIGEEFAMAFTMQDFIRQVVKEEFAEMTPAERETILQSVPVKSRLAGLTLEQIEEAQQYLDQLKASHKPAPRKPRRKR